jgi:V/A-type H+/Na+-transporting ATPase subunit I
MMFRPAAAQWFELLTSREELGAALDALARTKSIQLQAYSQSESRLPLGELRTVLDEYETLSRRYAPWWPSPELRTVAAEHAVLEAPQAALRSLRGWAAAAEPVVAELEALAVERQELAALARLCAAGPAALPRLDRMAQAGPVLASRVYALPPGTPALVVPPAVLHQLWSPEPGTTGGTFLLAVGPSEDMLELDAALSARKARRIALPPDLPSEPEALVASLAGRERALEGRAQHAATALARLAEQHGLPGALGELALAAWVVAHVPELPVTEHFAWVTGWCSEADDCGLRAALDGRGLHYLLRLTPAPEGTVPPTVLRNPKWARPFETVTGMMGVPGAREADPSVRVAILAPLMFGFMFGDVAQGAIVAVAGFFLGRRVPALRLLVPGGLVAIAFGLAFGSVFAREDVIPALWLHPLQHPLPVLGVALGFGVVTILIGLMLNTLQRAWAGELGHWLASEAGLLFAYLGIVGAALDMRALWALPLGLAWALGGAAAIAPQGRLAAAGQAAGESVERLLQLSVNTISFVRVGAFALAHAGLCTAVVGMAEAAGSGYWPVLIIGNAAIVALEGLVVSIQTTRLVLFEFFIRFLVARGRPFEPLAPPPASLSGGKSS